MKAKFIQALILAGIALPLVAQQAKADSITFDASPKTGTPAKVNVTMDDTSNPGKITVTVKVDVAATGNTADINGVYMNLPSGVGTLEIGNVDGSVNTAASKQGSSINNLGDGVNMNGGNTYTSFNLGVRIGVSGGIPPGDDFQATTFTLSDPNGKLTLASLSGLDFGVRLKSVGPVGSSRQGSSKIGSPTGTVVADNPGGGGGGGGGGDTTGGGGDTVGGGGDTGSGGGGGTGGGGGGGGDVEQVPEPTTMGGLALGFGALMKWRSQRKNQKQ